MDIIAPPASKEIGLMIKVITLAQIFFRYIPYNYSLSYAVETGYIRLLVLT